MTTQELSANLKKVQDLIDSQYVEFANNPQIGIGLGATAFAMIKTRIQKTGKGPDDAPYKPYSTKPTLIGASSFRTETNAKDFFGSKKKRSEMQWRTVNTNKGPRSLVLLPGGYRELQRLDGKKNLAFKDFTRTTEMWDSIHVMGTTGGNGKFVTTVGTENDLSKKKLAGNVKREGKEILLVTKTEEKNLNELLDKFVTKIINKAING